MGYRGIFALLLLSPAYLWGQLADTSQTVLDEVEVVEKTQQQRSNLRNVEGTSIYAGKKTEVVNINELIMNKGANTTRQLLSNITGLTIFENDDAGLQLSVGSRGLDPNRTSNFNTRQNGYEISADPLGYPESYYTPTSEGIQQIEVVRGAASLQYGSQFGGLLNFKMVEPSRTKAWSLEHGTTLGSFGLRTHFTSGSFNKGAVRGYGYHNYRASNGFRPNGSFDAQHTYADVRWTPNEQHEFGIQHTYLYYLASQPGGLTDSQFLMDPFQSNRSRNFFQVGWNLLNLNWTFTPSPLTTLSVQAVALEAQRYSLGFRGIQSMLNLNPILTVDEQNPDGSYVYERDLIAGSFSNRVVEAKILHRYFSMGLPRVALFGVKAFQSNNLSEQGAGSRGADADFSFFNATYPDYPNQSSFTFPNTNLAAFGEHIFYLNNHWTITPGVRAEYIRTQAEGSYTNVVFDNAGNVIDRSTLSDDFDFGRSIFLVGLGVSRKKNGQERYFNISQNYRSVTFSDIRTVNPTFIIDPEISDESGWTSDIGMRGKRGAVTYDANIFALYYANRIGIVFNNRAQRVRKNIGAALMYGLESYVSYKLPYKGSALNTNIYSNLSLTDSRYIISEVPNVQGKKVEFVPLLNLRTGILTSFKNFKFSGQFTAFSKQFTDVENSDAAQAGDLRDGILGPIPAYQILDFSAAYNYSKFTFEAGINNALNQSYFTRRALGYPGPGIIPSAPRNFYVSARIKLEPKKSKSLQ